MQDDTGKYSVDLVVYTIHVPNLRVEIIVYHILPKGQKSPPPKGAVVAESFLYDLDELTRSTSRGTRKEMGECKVLRVCIPYGKASLGLREGTV